MSKHHYREISKGAWARLRRRILARDGWRCRMCGKAGKMEVDHVVPLERGGAEADPLNLQALCRACHIEKTRAENRKPVPAQVQAWHEFVRSLTY